MARRGAAQIATNFRLALFLQLCRQPSEQRRKSRATLATVLSHALADDAPKAEPRPEENENVPSSSTIRFHRKKDSAHSVKKFFSLRTQFQWD
ncbi:hypothetical protein V9T40_010575 [Parthenolecanium corni]|uniref:Uncharacterized protein n=1 Tax=Parthenolecanium corni TaxID=536013 RepID=A0AAN9T7D9_9HEMI